MQDEPRGQDVGAMGWCPDTRLQWVHALRNAVGAAGVGTVLAQRLLDRGDLEGARAMLLRNETAWARCRDLLASADDATALPGVPGPPLSEALRAPTSSDARR